LYDELISRWAVETPDNPAVIAPNGSVSFATFDAEINKVAAGLQALNLPPTSRLDIMIADDYPHWLLVLALDRLGLVSASLGMGRGQRPLLAALKPDLVLISPDVDIDSRFRTFRVSPEWFRAALDSPPCFRLPSQRRADQPVRIFGSSGTTGTPKLMAFTRSQVTARVDASRASYRADVQSRACSLIGSDTSGGYLWPLVFWSSGGAVLLNTGSAASIGEELRRTQVTHLVTSPAILASLIRSSSANLSFMPSLEIHVAGSVLPKSLAAEVAKRLSPKLVTRYAAAEVGGMAFGNLELIERHNGTVGRIAASAEVQVVDEAGKTLPPGSTGILRARTAGMFTGYLDDPKATAAALKDGWFYPGDYGSVSADGLLVVAGRIVEVINIGGNKYAPHEFEDVVLDCAGIRDAAAFTVPEALGVERLWIAVVRGDDHRKGEVVEKLRSRWPTINVRVAVTNDIPRNQMGKIDRPKLMQLASAWADASNGAASPT
jgi:acyl-coenzyme A synthetase/AMP-(fatty) acid ligase